MKIPNLILLVAVSGTAAVGQNSDVGILLGVSTTRIDFARRTSADPTAGFDAPSVTQVDAILQVNYARQFFESSKGRLYLELPVSVAGATFFTPGLRYHFNVTPRTVLYAAAGVGLAVQYSSPIFNSPFHRQWRVSPAYDVAAGVDFRLTRLFSMRGEVLRIRTISDSTIGYGRTFPSAQFGFALHF